MDSQDVCLKLNISPRTLQTLRDNGKLPYSQIQHKIFYKPDDVEALLTFTGILSYYQLGGKILYKESDVEKLLEDNYYKTFHEE